MYEFENLKSIPDSSQGIGISSADEEAVMQFLVSKFEPLDEPPVEDYETVASKAKMLFPNNVYEKFINLPDEDSEEEIDLEFEDGEIIVLQPEPFVPTEAFVISSLVKKVKKLTSLVDLKEEDWNEINTEVIENFLRNHMENLLTIYYDGDNLIARLGIPNIRYECLTYFIRIDNQELRSIEMFNQSILYGTLDQYPEECLLNLLESIYGPIFFRIKDYPPNIKSDLCFTISELLMDMTQLRFNMTGLTGIYIPPEVIPKDVQKACKNLTLIKRLDYIILRMFTNIRNAINDVRVMPPEDEPHPLEIFQFWGHRFDNLCSIWHQLKDPLLAHVCKILLAAQSNYVKNFLSVIKDVKDAKDIAKCNVCYLKIMYPPCMELYNVVQPAEIPEFIPQVLFTFKVIWMNAPYFNTRDQFQYLLFSLSNQIVYVCKKFLDFGLVIHRKPRQALKVFKSVLYGCVKYKELYDMASLLHNRYNNKRWDVNSESVFNQIDTLVQRCRDVIEVCETLIIFGRVDEVNHIPKPHFGWTPAKEYSKIIDKIESRFWEYFKLILEVQDTLLFLYTNDWPSKVIKFRQGIRELELLIENLLESLFQTINNVEEGIDVLQIMYQYSKRINLYIIFEQYTTKVYSMMLEEILDAKNQLQADKREHPIRMPRYSGRTVIFLLKKKRIKTLHQKLLKAEWMVECNLRAELSEQYDLLITAYDQEIYRLFHRWISLIPESIVYKLSNALLLRSNKITGLLEINFDYTVNRILHESKFWVKMDKQIPIDAHQIYNVEKNITYIQTRLHLIVTQYNIIEITLSDTERILFEPILTQLERQILPGFTDKYSWLSTSVDVYLNECTVHLNNLKEFIEEYKACNLEIASYCEKISLINFNQASSGHIYVLQQYKNFQNKGIDSGVCKILECIDMIHMCTKVILEGFEPYLAQMMCSWYSYISRVDKIIESSILRCVTVSMESILSCMRGVASLGPSIVFRVWLYLKNGSITSEPTVLDFVTLAKNTLSNIMVSLRIIERFSNRCNVKVHKRLINYAAVIALDKNLAEIQQNIEKEMGLSMNALRSYTNDWMPFKEIWEVDRQLFLIKYEMHDPEANIFYKDITRFLQFTDEANDMLPYVNFRLFMVDSKKLRDTIIEFCEKWVQGLTNLLLKIVCRKIENLYRYCDLNVKKLKDLPKNQYALTSSIDFYRKLASEIPSKEKEFPQLKEQIDILLGFRDDFPPVLLDRENGLADLWQNYKLALEETDKMLQICQAEFKNKLLDQAGEFKKSALELLERFRKYGPFDPTWDTISGLKQMRIVWDLFLEMLDIQNLIYRDLELFKVTYHEPPEMIIVKEELLGLQEVWELTFEWDQAWEEYKYSKFWDIKTEDMENTVQKLFKRLNYLVREYRNKNWPIVEHSKKRVDSFKRVLPLINDLKNKAMRGRHWDAVKTLIGHDFDEAAPTFTLELIMSLKMQDFADDINEISTAATMELNIEKNIKTIEDTWKNIKLDMVPHKVKRMYRLKGVDEIFQILEEHLAQISSMKGTRYVQPFIEEVNYWEKNLALVLDVLEMSLNVQRSYLYLENIFSGEDIQKQLPKESDDFFKIIQSWTKITYEMHHDKYTFIACRRDGLIKTLTKMLASLEIIQRALETYLETKRQIFPRFYFISNDDLLEILGNSKKPELIQPHFKKCFDNINKIVMVKQQMAPFNMEGKAMISGDGEVIDFKKSVLLEGPVEAWLKEIELLMRITLRDVLKDVKVALKKNLNKRDKWIRDWPGQLCITSSQIQWTIDCTRTLFFCEQTGRKKPLKRLRKKQNQVLEKFSSAVRSNLTKIDRLKIVALVTIEIHARDVIDKMYKTNTLDTNSFEWLSQLRFYWDRDVDDCIIRQTNTHFVYGYEYLGNSGRLVITPLTDRCYITLTTALHLYRGGSPKGPAGTGKTETVKDLGKALGYYVIVINCSEGLDYKSMGRMFSGMAQTGAWICYDEFNRINIEVLSVVAQQVLSIISALTQKLTKFKFEGFAITLVPTCGIFITMNPGYAGRTELPDNLKSMFRPISMMVPDSMLIAEITLFGEGFRNTRILARKGDTLFSLCKQQLSKQDHYDFGLRGMVALLRYAGKKRRKHQDLTDDEVLLLAMKDMNIAKLTSDDLPLFNGITRDLFPFVELPVIDYEVMYKVMREVMASEGIQPIPAAMTKVIQLYETKGSRHSVMIVGASGAAKSVTWKVLKSTMTILRQNGVPGYEIPQEFPINPKAVNLGELYGEFNLGTGEWLDGILSSIMRKTCADESPVEKWILFDGPVDAVWIENMNSVMDDNKILTLINSERITMPEQVSLLFEVEDLVVASPATVSRCGIVFNDYNDFTWWPYVNSWIAKSKSALYKSCMEIHFKRYIQAVLDFKKFHTVDVVAVPELCQIISLCRLLECLAPPEKCTPVGNVRNYEESFSYLTRLWFLFCLIWSLGATVNEVGKEKLDLFIREMEGVFPMSDTIYEYFVNVKQNCMSHWEDQLKADWTYNPEVPFYKITVPTVDTVRYQYLTAALLQNRYPVMLVGVVGTGKTSTAMSVLSSLDDTKYSLLIINMSAQTTSNNVQDTIESRVEKRTKGIYYPFGNKVMICFMDDFNMPKKEVYGAQPPLELIRQWIDYGFWYNRQTQQTTSVKDMLLMSSMGPPGGGRNSISNRLTSRFSVINVAFPADQQISRIFNSMLSQHLSSFISTVRSMSEGITRMTIQLFKEVVVKMLPTPAKMHYLFNLRDISKVFQGLLRASVDFQNSKQALLRLWIHEAFRVYCDRLTDSNDQDWFADQINAQLGLNFEVTFNSLCSGRVVPIFCSFLNQYGLYEDIADLSILRSALDKKLMEYNESAGSARLNIVLFKEAIEHVCRCARIVSQPRGHCLLVGIGGSGRQSMCRIAAYMCDLSMFQIEIKRNYGLTEFREDLKSLYSVAGVKDTPSCFLFNDTQVTDESFLEILNNVLSTGEVSNLYKAEEFEEIKEGLYNPCKKAGVVPTAENIYTFLIDRVRANLHIVLSMSYVGDAFRHRLRQYPSLINCTTIDWYVEWPPSALLEVARKFVSDVNMLETITGIQVEFDPKENIIFNKQDKLRESVSTVFSLIHDSVFRYSRKMLAELKRHNYVTPINYLELVAGYKGLLAEKRKLMADSANKLRNGLFKIAETSEKVSEMTVELEKATVEVAQMNKDCDDFLVLLMSQKREADEQQKIVAANSLKIGAEEVECKALAEIALADLQEALPALQEAMQALEALNKKDMSEIKSYGRPPQKVEMVMEAVMILKKADPTWAEAKRQLGDVNFLNQLKEFDKDHIPDKVLRKIANYTQNPEFEPEKIGMVSVAAKSLAMWVIAIEKYGKIYRIVAPKKAKVDEAMESLRIKQAMLAEAQGKLEQLHQLIARLKRDYDEKLHMKEELRKKAEMLTKKLDRAAQLLEGLSGESVRWQETVVRLDASFELLLGDVLLATAFLSYMGPFVSQYREQLIEEWIKIVKDAELPYSEEFRVDEFLSDAATIREWNIQGLPTDSFNSENGIIVTRGSRWPLMVDPQCQGWKWIRNKEANNGLQVVDFGVPNYMRIIEMAMALGTPVLLQNISEVIDPSIIPVLNKAIIHKGNRIYIKVGDRLADYNMNFRFFISTKLSNPHYPPEICTLTTIVNFAIKDEGLQAQLLGLVVREDKPRLEQIKDSLVVNISTGKRTLKELEDELLRVLNESEGSLLDNDELFNTLKTSKATAISVNEQLEVSITTEVEIDSVREGYRPCAQRASILFFVLNDMSKIDPMYQWSLDSYNDIFINSIRKSKKSEDIDERIQSLNETHTFSVYRNICRGLFEKHKLLFSFYMCIQILYQRGEIQMYEYLFLLKGGVVLNRDEQAESPCAWIPEEAWDNITELDKIPGFIGVTKTFEAFPKEWKDWFFSTAPETQEIIGEWENKCNQFQKMLFIRCLRPDRLSFSISTFVSDQLGQKYTEPPVLDVKQVLEDSSNKTPLVFVLSPGVDPTGQLLTLAETSKMTTRFKTLSLGQGQAPYATRLIEQGVIHGHWVFLANCHLSLSWMPALDKIVEVLQTSRDTHPEFRLWLSSSPHPDFPISILQSAIKMTTEPPKGVRANMKRLYNLISQAQFSACKMAHKYKKLLFSLCFFHAVLLERKKFQQLGWNVIYSFNDSDFEISENILALYLDEYKDTPWDALKYLIAGICYGGHVTDDWDRRLLLTYINSYFNNDTINVPFFKLSRLPYYFIPEATSLVAFQDFVAALPQVDHPGLFGQHPNADITSLMIDTRVLCETLMSIVVQETSSGALTKEEMVMQLAIDILSKIPRPIDYDTTNKNIGPNKSPLDVVLLQEITRYNKLLVSIIDSLSDLQKGIKGLVVMSSMLEDIFQCIFEGRVPPLWLKAYATLKPLGGWTRDLIHRVEHFNKWAETVRPPILFWLASFTFPTGFLTAVLQKHARENQVSVDTLSWEFAPQALPENEIQIPSSDGVYVRSMFLEGAGWNQKMLCLAEPGPMQLVANLPVVLFKPCEISKKKGKGLYQCPVYYYPIRTGPQGRESFIIAVDLKSGEETPDFWVKRATAILLSLSN